MKHMYSLQSPRKWVTQLCVILCLCGLQQKASAQTVSASCSGASAITVGNCTTNQNFNDATVSDAGTNGCMAFTVADGWFSFVATSTRTYVSFTNNSTRDAALAVYASSCGSGMSPMTNGCADATGGGGDEAVTVTTVIGNTYRIRLARFSGIGSGSLNGSVCVYNAPIVNSFSPSAVCAGGTVVITGSAFTGATGVLINGTAVTSFTVNSATQITATVAAGTTSGTIVVHGLGNSTGTSGSSITINPTPVATATPSSQTLCGNGTSSFALSSSTAGTSYTWTVVQTNVSGGSNCSAACGTSIAQSLSNMNGTSAGTAVYSITPATASCTGSAITATVTVNPKPVGSAANATPAICSLTSPADALSSTVAGTTYSWTVSQSGVTGASNCSSSCGSSINQTLTASGAIAGTATYTVTPTASSCAGNTFTVTVTVNPRPGVTITPSTETFCGSGTTNMALGSNVAGATFGWTVVQSGVSGGAAGSGSAIAETISATGGSQGTATYTVTATANGCSGTSGTSTVTVNPRPAVTLASSASDLCSGSTAMLTAVSSGGTLGNINGTNSTSASIPDNSSTGISRSITLPAGIMTSASNLTVTLNITHTWVGDLVVTLTSPCGTTTIFDRPGVPASTNGNSNNLSGSYTFTTAAVNGLSETGAVSAGSYKPTNTAGSTHNFSGLTFPCANTAGTWTLTIKDLASGDNGTLSSWSVAISNALPYTAVFSGPASIGATAYSGASNTTATALVTPPSGSNSYTVVVTDGIGCSSLVSSPVSLNVYNLPVATALPASQTICSDGTLADILLNTSNGIAGTTFSWTRDNTLSVTGIASSGSGDISGSLSNTTNAPVTVTFTITPTGPLPTNCAGAPITATVLVNPTPVATSTPSGVTICEGASTNFVLTSTVAGTTFGWTVVQDADITGGTAGSGASISQALNNSGTVTEFATYSIVPTANGCAGSAITAVANVSAVLSASASLVSDATCSGSADGVVSVSPAGGTAPYTVSPAVTGLVAGTYTFTVTDATGCTAITGPVTVSEPSALSATVSSTAILCNGGTASVTVSASGGTAPYVGEGTFNVSAGTYSYTVTDANGCSASAGITVTEPSLLTASSSSPAILCNGGIVNVTVSASGGTSPYVGEGTFAVGAGTYNYTVTDANGCTASIGILLTEPTALSATSTATAILCNAGNATVTVLASGGTAPYSGDGNFTVQAGTYSYTVTDANGCTSSTGITISEPSALSASSVSTVILCNGGSSTVTVTAAGGTSPYGGEGNFTVNAGTYNYTVTDDNGCTASTSITVAEPALLEAVSGSLVDESCPGVADGGVVISATGGVAPYSGTGAFSGLTAGTYTYSVTDANGCVSTVSVTIATTNTISVAASSVNPSSSSICLGSAVTLDVVGGSLGSGADWVWYEGGCGAGAPVGTGASLSLTPVTAGTHVYFVRAEGVCGMTSCVPVSVNVIAVLPAPISILSAPVSGCVGGTGVITCATVPGASGYIWSAPVGVLINGAAAPVTTVSTSVTLTFTALPAAGLSGWNVCVAASNACGTSANTKCHWIRATISTPSVISGSVVGCAGNTSTYSVASVDGAVSYTWTVSGGHAMLNGGGTTVTTTTPNVNVHFLGTFTTGQLCVYATTACGYNSSSRCLTISNAPAIPGAINGSTTICPGSSSVYTITPVAGASSYIWSTTGTGVSVLGSGTSATVNTTGSFTSGSVCVIAVSACGSPLGNSPQRCKTIGTGKLPTPGNITGDPTTGVCGQTYQYSIASMSGATLGYSWSLPAGAISVSPPNSNTITVQFPASFTSGQICVAGVNGCGNGFSRCINVFGNPGTPSSISGNQGVCAGSTEVYTWPSIPGATSYQVIVPSGSTVLTGTPTIGTFAVVQWGLTAGNIGVKAQNSCGVSGTRTLPVSVVCRLAQTITTANSIETKVYPNPAHGQFNVNFTASASEKIVLRVLDQTGRVVKESNVMATEGENVQQLDVTELSAGMYLVTLESERSGLSKYPLIIQ